MKQIKINKIASAKEPKELLDSFGVDITYNAISDKPIIVYNRLELLLKLTIKLNGVNTPVWLCKVVKQKEYCLVNDDEIKKLQQYEKLYKTHFGVEYIDHPDFDNHISLDTFTSEFENSFDKDDRTFILKDEAIGMTITNYDRNMSFFKSLDKEQFNASLMKLINKYHFKEIDNLEGLADCLYILVLDDYSQFYIGKTTQSLKDRIKAHWWAKVDWFRYFWGDFNYSRFSIDHFKMLDCTRIFVCENYQLFLKENKDESSSSAIKLANTYNSQVDLTMSDLEKAERIVINNSPVLYCLSDRPLLVDAPIYKKIKINLPELKLKDYIKIKAQEED